MMKNLSFLISKNKVFLVVKGFCFHFVFLRDGKPPAKSPPGEGEEFPLVEPPAGVESTIGALLSFV